MYTMRDLRRCARHNIRRYTIFFWPLPIAGKPREAGRNTGKLISNSSSITRREAVLMHGFSGWWPSTQLSAHPFAGGAEARCLCFEVSVADDARAQEKQRFACQSG
jgi:hypothetical protein